MKRLAAHGLKVRRRRGRPRVIIVIIACYATALVYVPALLRLGASTEVITVCAPPIIALTAETTRRLGRRGNAIRTGTVDR